MLYSDIRYNVNNKCSTDMKDEIKKILQDYMLTDLTLNDATRQVLYLFSVSKRLNLPNFIAGIMVGILICTIIIELAY